MEFGEVLVIVMEGFKGPDVGLLGCGSVLVVFSRLGMECSVNARSGLRFSWVVLERGCDAAAVAFRRGRFL